MFKILIVDDDISVLHGLESALSDIGDLRIAQTGAEAVRLVAEQPPDLLLLDFQLVETDGLSLLQQLRKDCGFSRTPVVFLSSAIDPTPQVAALKLDVLDWVSKPFDRELLRARVQSALTKARLYSFSARANRSVEMGDASILAVDDDPIALEAVGQALGNGHFHLRSATSADEALAQVRRKPPEVILLDVAMPGLDGFQLGSQLLAMPELAQTPILFITQMGELDVEIRALQMGAFDFVTKPFVPEILRARVGNAVRMRRRSMEALERSEAHWRRLSGEQLTAIVAQARDPIVALDDRGGVALANAAAREMTGDPSALCAGQSLPPWLENVVPLAVRTGASPLVTDLFINRPGLGGAYFDVSSQVIGTDRRRLVVLMFRDQTSHRQARILEEARVRHEAESQGRQLMLSYLMHEIGNPLNGVIGLTQLLLSSTTDPLSEGQRNKLSMVADSAAVLKRLMSDALDLARHESGMFNVQMEKVALRQIIESALGSVATVALRQNTRLSPPIGDVDGWVLADAVRLRQCLDNLLTNACKYGGHQGRVSICVLADEHNTEISVSDNGNGLDASQIARLFVPFERLGAQRLPGHGLGLAVTRMLAEAMGGRIEVSSQPGIGSRFSVILQTAANTSEVAG